MLNCKQTTYINTGVAGAAQNGLALVFCSSEMDQRVHLQPELLRRVSLRNENQNAQNVGSTEDHQGQGQVSPGQKYSQNVSQKGSQITQNTKQNSAKCFLSSGLT